MTSGEEENLNLNRPQSPLKGFMASTQRVRSNSGATCLQFAEVDGFKKVHPEH